LKSLRRQEDRLKKDFKNREVMYAGFLLDLEKARQLGLIDAPEFERAASEARRMHRRLTLMGKFLESNLFAQCRILLTLRREGLSKPEVASLMRRLVPQPLLLRVRLARSYAGVLMQRQRA